MYYELSTMIHKLTINQNRYLCIKANRSIAALQGAEESPGNAEHPAS